MSALHCHQTWQKKTYDRDATGGPTQCMVIHLKQQHMFLFLHRSSLFAVAFIVESFGR